MPPPVVKRFMTFFKDHTPIMRKQAHANLNFSFAFPCFYFILYRINQSLNVFRFWEQDTKVLTLNYEHCLKLIISMY